MDIQTGDSLGEQESAQERRATTRQIIDRLTSQRTEMLALYCRVAGLPGFEDKPDGQDESAEKVLQEFCQMLVDYVAAGHFGLYERIASGKERRKEVSDVAVRLYPGITKTTETALAFNDKYDCEDHCEIGSDFEKDLSELGETLAVRIELEDQLLKVMR